MALRQTKGLNLVSLTTRHLPVALVLLAPACGYWGRRPLDEPTAVQNQNPVWIWSGTTVKKWHAVVITPDSVVGIPFEDPLSCYLCRQAVARGTVDSMNLGYKTGFQKAAWNVTKGVGIVVGAFAIYAGICYLLGSPQDC